MSRALSAIVAVTVALVMSACGGGSGSFTPVSRPLPSYTPVPIPTHTRTPHYCDKTPQEIAFVQADHRAHPRLKDYSLCYDLKHAVSFCRHRPHGNASNLMDVFIENYGDYDFAIQHMCPRLLPYLHRSRFGFMEGDETVGHKFNQKSYHSVITPGTYETTQRGVSDCYWERETSGGSTIANNFIKFAPGHVVVTIYSSDGGFSSNGCGDWIRVGG